MKRSALKPGKPLKRRTPLKRAQTARKPRAISEASTAQRRKVHLQACAVCRRTPCDPAHLTPRSFRGCDHADCVIALCRDHHRAFDDGELDLLPYLSGQGFEVELAHMQLHYSDPLSVIFRLSGFRWVPEQTEKAA